eukprot:s1164_g3.t1
MARWHDAMLGGVHEGVGLLQAYGRCLRLVHALSGGAGMTWLEDRVAAAVMPERARQLRRDPLVKMVRDRLRSVDDETAALYRHLFMVGPVPQLSESIPNAIRSLEAGCGSAECLRQAMEAEMRISEVWCEALDAPELPRLTGSVIGALRPITPEEALNLLTGSGENNPAPLFGLRPGSRWNLGGARVGAPVCDVPSWCLDLTLPDPAVREFEVGSHPEPLAVLLGGIQGIPKWIAPQVLTLDQQRDFIKDAVLRLMPSGATMWERDGEEVCLPAARSVFLPSASMVANIVGPPAAHSLVGQLASYGTGNVLVTWPSCVGPLQPWIHYKSLLAEDADDFTTQAIESGVCVQSGRHRRKRRSGEVGRETEAKSRRLEEAVKYDADDRLTGHGLADKASDHQYRQFDEEPKVDTTKERESSRPGHSGSTNLVFLAPKSKLCAPGRDGVDSSVTQAPMSEGPSSSRKACDDAGSRSDFQTARRPTLGGHEGRSTRRPRSPSFSPLPRQRAAISQRRDTRSRSQGSSRPTGNVRLENV